MPSFSVVDVSQVQHDQRSPEDAVKEFEFPNPDTIEVIECDVLIVGGGVGGVSAAQAAAKSGLKICITEETDWLGGQMTSQGVPVLDEGRNFLIETSGANRSYQQFREHIRNYYRQNYKLSSRSKAEKYFNPGNCWDWVSQLSFEPKVALKAINELIDQFPNTNVYLRHTALKVETDGDKNITRVFTVNLDTGRWKAFKASTYIDASELGDLLSLSKAKYVTGSEPQQETGEPGAPKTADPENVQDYVFPFIVEFIPGTNNTIPKPKKYDEFNSQGSFSFRGFKMFENANQNANQDTNRLMPFWTYRRILDKQAFEDPKIPNDVAVINWFAGNDFRGHNIIDKPARVVSEYLALAKSLSMSFLYWLQTEAPCDDGGKGYPEIKLQTDALGSEDGMSKYPYIRESRRACATLTSIKEQDIVSSEAKARARIFNDSAGIGFFPIDIHGKDASEAELRITKHFQIPLGAMIPESPANLLLACKNIGTTHITNGAYRLHPIEWSIGEAAGSLAHYVIQNHAHPHEIVKNENKLRCFQLELIKAGVPLYWYDDVATTHPQFAAIQFLSITNGMQSNPSDLHFNPESMMTQEQMTRAQFAEQLYQEKAGSLCP